MGKCRYCSVEIKRSDNLKRHENFTCQNKRVTCDCGLEIAATSLQKHQKNHCPLQKTKFDDIVLPPMIKENDIESVEDKMIQFNAKIIKCKNGKVMLQHGEINISNTRMMLVPAAMLDKSEFYLDFIQYFEKKINCIATYGNTYNVFYSVNEFSLNAPSAEDVPNEHVEEDEKSGVVQCENEASSSNVDQTLGIESKGKISIFYNFDRNDLYLILIQLMRRNYRLNISMMMMISI